MPGFRLERHTLESLFLLSDFQEKTKAFSNVLFAMSKRLKFNDADFNKIDVF